MQRPQQALKRRASAVTGLAAVVTLVGLPVEVTIGLAEQPVLAPPLAASLLLIASCLLLVGSGLGLRRLATARSAVPPPVPGL